MRMKFSLVLIALAALGTIASAHAQAIQYGTGGGGGGYSGGGYYRGGGYYNGYAGSGVPTGRGPMSQPIPPAVSTFNRGQNLQQDPYRPQNQRGPALTNPSQYPFGAQ